MSTKKTNLIFGCITVVALLAVGCAKGVPPLDRMEAAKRAVEAAESNGAVTDAPLELYVARENLEEARDALNKKKYMQARRMADAALVQAELADAKSRNAYWTRSANELKAELDSLQAAIEAESAR